MTRRIAPFVLAAFAAGCTASAHIREPKPNAVVPNQKAPVQVAWVDPEDSAPKPFKAGIACFNPVMVHMPPMTEMLGGVLNAYFERVVPYPSSAPAPAGADAILHARVGEAGVRINIVDAATRDHLFTMGEWNYGPPFYSADTTLCTIGMFMPFVLPSAMNPVAANYEAYYNSLLSRAMQSVVDSMPRAAARLSAYKTVAGAAAADIAEAGRLAKEGDKAKAFTMLNKIALAAPYGSRHFNAAVDAMLPLVPHTDTPPVTDDARRLMTQGQTKFKDAKHDEALLLFAEAAQQCPWWPAAWYNIGIGYEGRKNYKEAALAFKRYVAAAPDAKDAEETKKRAWALEAK
ncbi:MAG: hypothetical protein HY078_13345 [Elusimicrobia bacterium]|nr:hypothetical protein [Elusimicrobiota bacterium]